MDISLNTENLKGFIEKKDFEGILPQVRKAHETLEKRNGPGKEFTGWLDLPTKTSDKFLKEIAQIAQDVRKNSDVLVNIGIGGSYLGVRAAAQFLSHKVKIPIEYAGHNLGADDLSGLIKTLEKKKVSVIVISKSGTTTEPALAFRIIKKLMMKKYSAKELKKRIICVTDEKKGALRTIAQKEGYPAFAIPDDVGGRFSVLTPAGLVPLAIAGIDIKALIEGARQAQFQFSQIDLKGNIA